MTKKLYKQGEITRTVEGIPPDHNALIEVKSTEPGAPLEMTVRCSWRLSEKLMRQIPKSLEWEEVTVQ